MKNKWWCLFGVHEYETFDTHRVRDEDRYGRWIEYHRLYLRCKCCGKAKFKDMK